ncbi:hypothetical protein HanXRQr2_Chr13g0586121 [Helianthus annuus]|uniref:Uncharacterized protein n=1 Tax=Helianthus annuus TaxID=4232 RepID=A0A9K3EH81_HELAN|nr:hypothetical protein HanXRQr2_Chr13g0586121 [Helianthus annuus]
MIRFRMFQNFKLRFGPLRSSIISVNFKVIQPQKRVLTRRSRRHCSLTPGRRRPGTTTSGNGLTRPGCAPRPGRPDSSRTTTNWKRVCIPNNIFQIIIRSHQNSSKNHELEGYPDGIRVN